MLNKFLETVSKYNMFSAGEHVLACVSGGADSVAMLLLLNDAKDLLNIDISVAHVNHMIRGKEADRDEDFVKNLCNTLNLPCITTQIDIPKLAADRHESLELVARDERYKFFNSLNFDKICTAHTKSDRIETFIMNFSRGCGLNGLTSIPPVRDNIVRPLIDFSRSETEKCCTLHNFSYVTDSTNLIADCTRNKIRLNIIPELNLIFDGFENNVNRCISNISQDDICLNSYAEKLFLDSYDSKKKILLTTILEDCMPAVKSRVVVSFINIISDCSPEKKHIDYICENIGNKFSITLPGGIEISGNGSYIFEQKKSDNSQFYLRLSKYDNNQFDYNGNHFSCFPSDSNHENTDNCLLIDFETVDNDFCVRSRNPGDSIKIKNRKCTKSIKKLFNELKLSQSERDSSLFFEDSNGIFAISGFDNKINNSNRKNGKYLVIKFRRY